MSDRIGERCRHHGRGSSPPWRWARCSWRSRARWWRWWQLHRWCVGGSRSSSTGPARADLRPRVHEGKAAHWRAASASPRRANWQVRRWACWVRCSASCSPSPSAPRWPSAPLAATFAMLHPPAQGGAQLRQILGPVPGVSGWQQYASCPPSGFLPRHWPWRCSAPSSLRSCSGGTRVAGASCARCTGWVVGIGFSFAIARTGQKLAYGIIVVGNGALLMLAVVTAEWCGSWARSCSASVSSSTPKRASSRLHDRRGLQPRPARRRHGRLRHLLAAALSWWGPAIFGPGLPDVTSIETALLVALVLDAGVPGLLTRLCTRQPGTRSTP